LKKKGKHRLAKLGGGVSAATKKKKKKKEVPREARKRSNRGRLWKRWKERGESQKHKIWIYHMRHNLRQKRANSQNTPRNNYIGRGEAKLRTKKKR